jgi:hypothetical protein
MGEAQAFLGAAYQGDLQCLEHFGAVCGYTVCDGEGRNGVHYACAGGRAEVLAVLAKRGVDLNARDHMGVSPVLLAAGTNQLTCALFLMERGALTDAQVFFFDPIHFSFCSSPFFVFLSFFASLKVVSSLSLSRPGL